MEQPERLQNMHRLKMRQAYIQIERHFFIVDSGFWEANKYTIKS